MANARPDRYGARVRITAPAARYRAFGSGSGLMCLAVAVAMASCGDKKSDASGRPAAVGAGGERIELPASPDAAGLIDLIDGPHLDARRIVGPHRVTCSGSFKTAPQQDPGPPKVGEHRSTAVEVRDRSELVWASDDPHQATFSLSFSVDNDAPRPGDDVSQSFEARALDGSIYTQLPARPWNVRPLESDAHELWLDDVERCLLGPVKLAAPRLAVSGTPTAKGMVYRLSRASEASPGLVSTDPRAAWRAGASIESVEGEIVFGSDGLWTSGVIDVGYRADDVDGRLVRGTVHVEAKREIAPQTVQAPPNALPTPSRVRLQVERDELLDGLAG